MTPEQRLDRLERIAKLVVKSSLRALRHSRPRREDRYSNQGASKE